MASVVLKSRMALSADDLIAHCRRSLANYKVPRRVEFIDTELPKSGSGKILKRILRERSGLPSGEPLVEKSMFSRLRSEDCTYGIAELSQWRNLCN